MEIQRWKRNRFSSMKPSTCNANLVTGILRGGCSISCLTELMCGSQLQRHDSSQSMLSHQQFSISIHLRKRKLQMPVVVMPRYLASLFVPNSIRGSPKPNDYFCPVMDRSGHATNCSRHIMSTTSLLQLGRSNGNYMLWHGFSHPLPSSWGWYGFLVGLATKFILDKRFSR